MAITILQEPTSPNVTGTNLIYSVSSSNVPQFQFRYIADLYYSGSADKLARFKYPQNNFGTANIELSRPIGDYLNYDYNWKYSRADYLAGVTPLVNSVKSFEVKVGEEYGTSYNSPITTFPDIVSGSLEAFKGSVYVSNTTNGFNWVPQSLLTNSPATQSFSPNDYLTATVYDTYGLGFRVKYFKDGNLIDLLIYNSTEKFTTIPVGPLNVNNSFDSDVIILEEIPPNPSTVGSSIKYEVENDCRSDRHRLAFINKFGFWDYYTCNTALKRKTNIDRKTYDQSFADLSQRVTTFDAANRGELQYYTEYTDEFEFTTDSVTSEESQWLREMFESSEVFIQSGSNFIPINILNTTETISNNTARNKNYQYTVRYQFSNLREPR